MGLIPEEIARKFGHLSLAQVHAALSYYHTNQAEIDADLETEARETEALVRKHRPWSLCVSQIETYIDEDAMDGDLVVALRSRGVTVVTALDVGWPGRTTRNI
jgi:hypothetical protein